MFVACAILEVSVVEGMNMHFYELNIVYDLFCITTLKITLFLIGYNLLF